MILNSMLLEPTQLILEISETTQTNAWQNSQSAATPNSRWNSYLNRVCLDAFLSWLKEERDAQARVWHQNTDLAHLWELVEGVAIESEGMRLVLIPSETIDLGELRVPQEWVDIADWRADYYLAVQVNLDDEYIRVNGYCTHKQLKESGTYNQSDRTYALDEDDLTSDLSVLWLTREFCADEITKSTVSPLTTISSEQAHNLIERLGNTSILVPRLAIPFQFWSALLSDRNNIKRLAQKRQGLAERNSVLAWFAAGAANLAQEFGWKQVEFQASPVGFRGVDLAPVDSQETNSAQTNSSIAFLSKQLIISQTPYELRILPIDRNSEMIWRFELHSLSIGGKIPTGFKLRLLSEDLQPFEKNERVAEAPTDMLDIEVMLESGEGLVWEIEPTPDNYQSEVLFF